MSNETRRCNNCVFFFLPGKDSERKVGNCRKGPPTSIQYPSYSYSVWPEVQREDWCGEHKYREPALPATDDANRGQMRLRCGKCPHPPHFGVCKKRSGQTAYECGCTSTSSVMTRDVVDEIEALRTYNDNLRWENAALQKKVELYQKYESGGNEIFEALADPWSAFGRVRKERNDLRQEVLRLRTIHSAIQSLKLSPEAHNALLAIQLDLEGAFRAALDKANARASRIVGRLLKDRSALRKKLRSSK